MSYVAVKGGEGAIRAAHQRVANQLPKPESAPEAWEAVLTHQRLAVDRVMAEAGLYAPRRAAEALIQSQGDIVEAVFLLRAYRSTLPRLQSAEPLHRDDLNGERRISAAFKDIPGGQQLGTTYDYAHRLLGYFDEYHTPVTPTTTDHQTPPEISSSPDLMALLVREGLLEANPEPNTSEGAQPTDLIHGPLHFPAPRALRLQSLARADEGFLLGLGYSTQRGYGDTHPFLGELRQGLARITLRLPELDAPITVGRIPVTECQMIQQYDGNEASAPQMTRGYGLVLGQSERKAMAMALVDRALQVQERGESIDAHAQDQEFVLSHADNVAASGFVEHLKLPHHVDFQTELAVLRTLRRTTTAETVHHEP